MKLSVGDRIKIQEELNPEMAEVLRKNKELEVYFKVVGILNDKKTAQIALGPGIIGEIRINEKSLKFKPYCGHCSEEIKEGEEWIEFKGHRFCSKCYKEASIKCKYCGKMFFDELYLFYGINTSDYCCPKCKNRVVVCECGKTYLKDEGYTDEGGNKWCCKECAKTPYWDNTYLHSYDDKYVPIFLGEKNELKMGVELEVDKNEWKENGVEDLVCDLSDVNRYILCKHDGSLTENGVEIVTPPCSLGYHLNSFNWEDIVKTCINHNYRSDQTSTCGLHIHVDRRYFGTASNRAAVYLTSILDKFYEQFLNFSRRRSNRLEEWAKVEEINLEDGISYCYDAIGESRYKAINVCNLETLEFRLWKGSLNLETLYATLEMTQLLCDLVRSVKDVIEIDELQWEDICELASPYAELQSYLKRRNLYVKKEEII